MRAQALGWLFRPINYLAHSVAGRGTLGLAITLLAVGWLVAPASVSAAGGSACQITLTWMETDGSVDGFKIERALSDFGPWTQIAQVPPRPTSYQDTAVLSGVIYYYRLRAYNSAGDSGYSNVAGGSARCLGGTDSVGDGIPNAWRAQYFPSQPSNNGNGTMTNSQSCATCDADGTGQNNLFKYVAGLDPTNPTSIFVLKIASVNGQPTQKNLIYNPIASGRTYTPQFRTNLVSGAWAALTGHSDPTTNINNQVTVTDLNASTPSKFYRIDIGLP